MKRWLLFALLIVSLSALGRVEPREGETPIVPEPQITIVEDKGQDAILHIYQVNGKIYGIRVFPNHGAPYNLVDTNGGGDYIRDSADRILVPEWVLKRF